jgi:hypothetical protein
MRIAAAEKIRSSVGGIVRWWQSLAAAPNGTADSQSHPVLLRRRMAALDIDPDKAARLEPELFRDLQALCRGCDQPKLCRHDLSQNPGGVAWEDYCPNAVVLNAISALRWFRSGGTQSAR